MFYFMIFSHKKKGCYIPVTNHYKDAFVVLCGTAFLHKYIAVLMSVFIGRN